VDVRRISLDERPAPGALATYLAASRHPSPPLASSALDRRPPAAPLAAVPADFARHCGDQAPPPRLLRRRLAFNRAVCSRRAPTMRLFAREERNGTGTGEAEGAREGRAYPSRAAMDTNGHAWCVACRHGQRRRGPASPPVVRLPARRSRPLDSSPGFRRLGVAGAYCCDELPLYPVHGRAHGRALPLATTRRSALHASTRQLYPW